MRHALIAVAALAVQAVSGTVIKRDGSCTKKQDTVSPPAANVNSAAPSSNTSVVWVTTTDYTTVPPQPKPTKTVQVTITESIMAQPSATAAPAPPANSTSVTAAPEPSTPSSGAPPVPAPPVSAPAATTPSSPDYPVHNHTLATNVTGQPETTITPSDALGAIPTLTPPGTVSAILTTSNAQGPESTAGASTPLLSCSTWPCGFTWPGAPASNQPAGTPAAPPPAPGTTSVPPSQPASVPPPPPVPSTAAQDAPASTPAPSSTTPLPSFVLDIPNSFASMTTKVTDPPDSASTMAPSSKTPEVIVIPAATTNAAKRDTEEAAHTILPHSLPAHKRSNTPRLPGYRNGVNPALDDEANAPPVERGNDGPLHVVSRDAGAIPEADAVVEDTYKLNVRHAPSTADPEDHHSTSKPSSAPHSNPTPKPTPRPSPTSPKPSPPPSNTPKRSPSTTSRPASATKSTNGNENVKTIVVSADPKCAYYPLPGCGKPSTTLTTETKKATGTGADTAKATKTGSCVYPYPDGHGQMC